MEFQNGKIYKVVCSETGNIYYGSTIKTLEDRFKGHKSPTNECRSKFFIKPSKNLIKDFPCNSKQELVDEESKYIKNLECVNKVIPNRTKKEYMKQYRLGNIEKQKEINKQYYIDNKEKLNKNQKQYRLDNFEKLNKKYDCECGGKYIHHCKARHFKTKKHLNYINSNIN